MHCQVGYFGRKRMKYVITKHMTLQEHFLIMLIQKVIRLAICFPHDVFVVANQLYFLETQMDSLFKATD